MMTKKNKGAFSTNVYRKKFTGFAEDAAAGGGGEEKIWEKFTARLYFLQRGADPDFLEASSGKELGKKLAEYCQQAQETESLAAARESRPERKVIGPITTDGIREETRIETENGKIARIVQITKIGAEEAVQEVDFHYYFGKTLFPNAKWVE